MRWVFDLIFSHPVTSAFAGGIIVGMLLERMHVIVSGRHKHPE